MLTVLLAGYVVVNYFSPEILYVVEPPDTTAKKLVSNKPGQDENRLYIPKLNADIVIIPAEGNEELGLEKGAVQRAVNNGNPKDGGNYVLVANRLSLGLTPMETKTKSSYYHLGKLSKGDDIYVDYGGTRYGYKVVDRKSGDTNVSDVEEQTDTPQLTLYSTEAADRQIIVAEQTGKIIWTNGQPKLQALPDS